MRIGLRNFADSLAIRIRASLQRCRKQNRIRVGFSRCSPRPSARHSNATASISPASPALEFAPHAAEPGFL
jgi:hypothetical protein